MRHTRVRRPRTPWAAARRRVLRGLVLSGLVLRGLVLGGVRAGVLLPLLLAGCREERFAQQRIDYRDANLRRTLDVAVESERSRPEKLSRTWRVIADTVEGDARQTRENAGELDAFIRRDFERFEERQDQYRRDIHRILRGKPERIERTAIKMIF